jgi:hypothetical protein
MQDETPFSVLLDALEYVWWLSTLPVIFVLLDFVFVF